MYLDIKIGNKQSGRIVVELRPDVVPKTAGKLSHFFVGFGRLLKMDLILDLLTDSSREGTFFSPKVLYYENMPIQIY